MKIGLIKEGKIPEDNRVALTPIQCQYILKEYKDVSIVVERSQNRCYSDKEYKMSGITLSDSLTECDIILGIKEIPVSQLIANKTYLFFSHTKKLQDHNRLMLQEIMKKNITLIDYECLEHADGARILGFGFFAGIVGAHNGMMAYGKRTGSFSLEKINPKKDFRFLIHSYFGLKLPNIKIAVTGSGRVAHGIIEVMNLLDIKEVEPDEYLEKEFTYPVYVHLKGADLYEHRITKLYDRKDFHSHPEFYQSKFKPYLSETDVLMNGVYWEEGIPRLFELSDMANNFRIQTISDISDDLYGSIPCNSKSGTSENPVYGVDKKSFQVTSPFLPSSVDIMAVGNLPNEMPRDASQYFGEQIIKELLDGLLSGQSTTITDATILKNGKLMPRFEYMKEYAGL